MVSYRLGAHRRDSNGFKSVVLIYLIAVVACFCAVWYANRCIDAVVSTPVEYQAQTVSKLVVPDTGFNDATDLLQTSAGINVYQDPLDGLGPEDNINYVLQEAYR